jgi:hypothetical protein
VTPGEEIKKIEEEAEKLRTETFGSLLRTIQSISHRTMVYEATLKVLISQHPRSPDLRPLVESMLAQVQTGAAQRGVDARGLGDLYKPILDGLFLPPIYLQPDED